MSLNREEAEKQHYESQIKRAQECIAKIESGELGVEELGKLDDLFLKENEEFLAQLNKK